MLDYTIIVPVYCNETSLALLYDELNEKVVSKNPLYKGQIVFVEDGSPDNSYNELLKIKERDTEDLVRIIKFTRNFGQTSGIYCALEKFESSCYVITSADLQDPVELINDFLSSHFNEDCHIVAGERSSRDDGFISEIFSKFFYSSLRKLTFPDYPKTGFDYILVSMKMRDIMLQLNDSDPFWQGQMMWSGLKRKFIPYERKKRVHGSSKYTFSKRVKYFIDGIFGFSFTPIRMISVAGLILAFIGFLYAAYIIIAKLFIYDSYSITGWPSVVTILLIASGIQILFLGIIGEYLWRTLSQTRNRPLYIVDKSI